MTATLRNFPSKVTTSNFSVTIDSVCTGTSLISGSAKKYIYWHGDYPTEADVTVSDTRSLNDDGDGYSLCGDRNYEITAFKIDCSNYVTMKGHEIFDGSNVEFDDVLEVCTDTSPSQDYYQFE